ncbi:MAG: hypothetical protein ACPGJS_08050 [Flammeovirgaceae bacterium]
MRYLILLLIPLFIFSCKDKECESSLIAAQTELDAYRRANQAMLQITSMLDSLDKGSDFLSPENDSLTREVVLNRIASSISMVENGQLKIQELESSIEELGSESQGLKAMVARLKRTIRVKQDSLIALNTRVEDLENENITMASTIWEQKREITMKNQIINQQKSELVSTQNELLMKEREAIEAEGEAARNARMIEATKFFEKARAEEQLGDKLSGLFKGKERQQRYQKAHDFYQKAYDLGKSEAKRAMIKLKEKMKKKKEKKK